MSHDTQIDASQAESFGPKEGEGGGGGFEEGDTGVLMEEIKIDGQLYLQKLGQVRETFRNQDRN